MILCPTCLSKFCGYKKVSLSQIDCQECGQKYVPPPGKNLKVKDKLHIVSATYPDIEGALNDEELWSKES